MCGIAGILSLDLSTPIDDLRLKRMRDVLTHRGPDDAGHWIEGPIGLGHRRLAIVDVTGGHQPMSNEDGTLQIVYNGEVYNHEGLRQQLEGRGHRYRTRCDTETILHLYEEEGERAVERLHGMFAFAIWDRRRKTLLLARDRLGIKPLYYALTTSELLFASEIKALFAAGLHPQLNEKALPAFLASRFVAGPATLFQGVKKLIPGYTLQWSAQKVTYRRYWQLASPGERRVRSAREEAAELRERLTDSVRRHLMSDVPVGLFLSGGLDSSALAAIAADLMDEPLRTFSVGFEEIEANELPYASRVAGAIKANHREVVLSRDKFFDALPTLIWHEDEPLAFTSSVPLHFLSMLAGDHVKVVLTGEGADELFLGYNRYRVTLWNARLGLPFWAVTSTAVRAKLRTAIARLPTAVRRVATRSFLALEPGDRSLFLENFAVFGDRARQELCPSEGLSDTDAYEVLLEYCATADGGLLDRVGHCDLQGYLHELLMKQDQMSMSASVESRVPFLDDSLVQYATTMPSAYKLALWTTKAVLKDAVRDLIPRDIIGRRKVGFPVPFSRWLRKDSWRIVEEFVLGPRTTERRQLNPLTLKRLAFEHRTERAEHGDRLWLLINLEIWQRIFFDGEPPHHVMRSLKRGTSVFYASTLGKDRGSLASQHRRSSSDLPDVIRAVRTPSCDVGNDTHE